MTIEKYYIRFVLTIPSTKKKFGMEARYNKRNYPRGRVIPLFFMKMQKNIEKSKIREMFAKHDIMYTIFATNYVSSKKRTFFH